MNKLSSDSLPTSPLSVQKQQATPYMLHRSRLSQRTHMLRPLKFKDFPNDARVRFHLVATMSHWEIVRHSPLIEDLGSYAPSNNIQDFVVHCFRGPRGDSLSFEWIFVEEDEGSLSLSGLFFQFMSERETLVTPRSSIMFSHLPAEWPPPRLSTGNNAHCSGGLYNEDDFLRRWRIPVEP